MHAYDASSGPTCSADAPARAPACGTLAEALNQACLCIGVDRAALDRALAAELGDSAVEQLVRQHRPHLFSERPVFVAAEQLARMAEVVAAVEQVVALPAWREHALATAPAIARHDAAGVRGVFFGYDFHASGSAFGLIEINTNAGGAMLNAVLARAQRACCSGIEQMQPSAADVAGFEHAIVEMFYSEWRAAQRSGPLVRVAIVDAAPTEQFLYPEFLLFQRLFAQHGIDAVIVDPADLAFRDGALYHGDAAIDLVYNRLTDFYLQSDACAALRQAYLRDAVVLTPHPQAHALYADKRRLAALSDPAFLQQLEVPSATQHVLLDSVPRTEVVHPDNADRLWAARRGLFFKPVAGFGSRATYRGDKLTRRVWQQIVAGDYVAQALVVPGERRIDSGAQAMKFDLRAWAYHGRIQWIAARVYQGQTTNLRTAGGGFAPVYSTAHASAAAAALAAGQTATPVGGAGEVGKAAAAAPGAGSPDPAGAASDAPAQYASYVFLLDGTGEVHPLPHALYVALARAEAAGATLAGRTLRLADWYVRLHDGAPQALVNEWYGLLRFDAEGRAAPVPAGPHPPAPEASPAPADPTVLPTADERARMHALVFGTEAGAAPAVCDASMR